LLLGCLYRLCKLFFCPQCLSLQRLIKFIPLTSIFFFLDVENLRPTYRRIIRNRSTEQFSGLPYIYALMNCLICMWYGMPLISADNLLVVTVNSFGTVFQLAYIILFIIYAERKIKVFIPFYLQNLSTFYGFYVLIHLHLLSLVAGRLVC
jgi:solute carrier family 50 protein (sugar transporter)